MASSCATDSPATTSPCLHCNEACTLRCARCKVVSLCSRECQEKTWKAHKAFCKGIANPTLSSINESASTCLIVDGMGPCGPNWDYMKLSKEALLNAGVHVCVIDATKGQNIPEQVSALFAWNEAKEARIRSILMLGFGSGGCDIEHDFSNSNPFREAAVSWVQKGGNFLVQGERVAGYGQWPQWFGKTWKDGDYYRTDHTCFARPSSIGEIMHWCKWYHQAAGAITRDINVKATLLKDVPQEEVLFGTVDGAKSYSLVPHMRGQSIGGGSAAVALGKCGEGTVSFFGDVNHQDETVRTIAILARGH